MNKTIEVQPLNEEEFLESTRKEYKRLKKEYSYLYKKYVDTLYAADVLDSVAPNNDIEMYNRLEEKYMRLKWERHRAKIDLKFQQARAQ